VKLTLPYPPSANKYWRSVRGRVLVSREARAYKQGVKLRALTAGVRPIEGPVHLTLAVYRPRRAGDLSNRIKVLEDALCGVAFEDDDQVESIHAMRFDDKENPRVEVSVEALPKPRALRCGGCDAPDCFHCGGVRTR
jgi:crossover junction endodeoxyribonuclease RusA